MINCIFKNQSWYVSLSILEVWVSLVAQMVNNLLAMQETQIRSLAREDPLEKGMANHSSILAWRIPWTKEPGRGSRGSQRIGQDWATNTYLLIEVYYTLWSRAKANRILPRKCTGHSKHPLPTTQEKTLHVDITRWSTPKSDWLYSLQPKMEKLYTVSKNKTGSWLRLRSWTLYCQI